MDFSSLGQGSPLYILRQGEKPTLDVGTVKAKTQPHVKFPTSTPNLMTGLQPQQVIDITVTLNGKDETLLLQKAMLRSVVVARQCCRQ